MEYIIGILLVIIFIQGYLLCVKKNTTTKAVESEEIKGLEETIFTSKAEIDFLNERENYRREYLGNVAHELKTPLFSIQGFSLTLLEGGADDITIRDKYLQRINKSVERLIYIVQDLDLISELETGRVSIDYKPFDIVALTQDVFELLEIKATKNDIALKFDCIYDSPYMVIGDTERIQQVFINLIHNAIKHSGSRGAIIISFTKENNRLKIAVSDNGIGITKEDQARIFERFYRVDKSRSRKQGGSGLGLSIVKHIIDAHNGSIKIDSAVGRGTTFTFDIELFNKTI